MARLPVWMSVTNERVEGRQFTFDVTCNPASALFFHDMKEYAERNGLEAHVPALREAHLRAAQKQAAS